MLKFDYKTTFTINYAVQGLMNDESVRKDWKSTSLTATAFQNGGDCEFTVITEATTDTPDNFNPDSDNPFLHEHKLSIDVLHLSIDSVNRHIVTRRLSESRLDLKSSHDFLEKFNTLRIGLGQPPIKKVTSSHCFAFDGRGTLTIDLLKRIVWLAKKALSSPNHREVLELFRSGAMSFTDPYKDWFKIVEGLRRVNYGGKPLISKDTCQISGVNPHFLNGFPQAFRHHWSSMHGSQATNQWAAEIGDPRASRARYINELSLLIDFYHDKIV